MLSQLSFQQKLLVYLQPSNTCLFQLISLPGRKRLFAAQVSLALHGCVLMKQGPAYSLELLEVHSAEIKNNLTTWLPDYRLLASLQIRNQPDETKILWLGSAGWAIFVNSVFSGKRPFQMDCQGLQVQVKWSKEFQLKTSRTKIVALKKFSLTSLKIICSRNVKWKLFAFSLQDGNFHLKIDLNFYREDIN